MHFLDHIWTFVTNLINVYIPSNILQILMNAVVHAQAFISSLVSHVYILSFWPSAEFIRILVKKLKKWQKIIKNFSWYLTSVFKLCSALWVTTLKCWNVDPPRLAKSIRYMAHLPKRILCNRHFSHVPNSKFRQVCSA